MAGAWTSRALRPELPLGHVADRFERGAVAAETTSLGNGAQPSSRRGESASHEPTLDRQRPRAALELGREQIRKLAVRADGAEGFEGGARLGRPRPPVLLRGRRESPDGRVPARDRVRPSRRSEQPDHATLGVPDEVRVIAEQLGDQERLLF